MGLNEQQLADLIKRFFPRRLLDSIGKQEEDGIINVRAATQPPSCGRGAQKEVNYGSLTAQTVGVDRLQSEIAAANLFFVGQDFRDESHRLATTCLLEQIARIKEAFAFSCEYGDWNVMGGDAGILFSDVGRDERFPAEIRKWYQKVSEIKGASERIYFPDGKTVMNVRKNVCYLESFIRSDGSQLYPQRMRELITNLFKLLPVTGSRGAKALVHVGSDLFTNKTFVSMVLEERIGMAPPGTKALVISQDRVRLGYALREPMQQVRPGIYQIIGAGRISEYVLVSDPTKDILAPVSSQIPVDVVEAAQIARESATPAQILSDPKTEARSSSGLEASGIESTNGKHDLLQYLREFVSASAVRVHEGMQAYERLSTEPAVQDAVKQGIDPFVEWRETEYYKKNGAVGSSVKQAVPAVDIPKEAPTEMLPQPGDELVGKVKEQGSNSEMYKKHRVLGVHVNAVLSGMTKIPLVLYEEPTKAGFKTTVLVPIGSERKGFAEQINAYILRITNETLPTANYTQTDIGELVGVTTDASVLEQKLRSSATGEEWRKKGYELEIITVRHGYAKQVKPVVRTEMPVSVSVSVDSGGSPKQTYEAWHSANLPRSQQANISLPDEQKMKELVTAGGMTYRREIGRSVGLLLLALADGKSHKFADAARAMAQTDETTVSAAIQFLRARPIKNQLLNLLEYGTDKTIKLRADYLASIKVSSLS